MSAYNALTNQIIAGLEGRVKTLAWAMVARDLSTSEHVARVSVFVGVIAEELGIGSKLKRQIVMGAILHDVGKIGIPDDILLRPGTLNSAESATMRSHVARGAEFVSSSVYFSSSVQSAVSSHHENFDGTGYPGKLKGENIRIGGRIIAVADAFDAMTTDRPYRKGIPQESGIAQVKKLTGTNFDPTVVEAFLRAYDQGRI